MGLDTVSENYKSKKRIDTYMDPITLITAAISMLTPYLIKSGEKIAEEMGGSLWSWLKSKISDKATIKENPDVDDKNAIQMQLMTLITQDSTFAQELEDMMRKIQKQNVENFGHIQVINNGNVDKQVNMTTNNGTINL